VYNNRVAATKNNRVQRASVPAFQKAVPESVAGSASATETSGGPSNSVLHASQDASADEALTRWKLLLDVLVEEIKSRLVVTFLCLACVSSYRVSVLLFLDTLSR
jgi:hypothetical protein